MTLEIGFRDLYIPLSSPDEGQSNRAPISMLDDDERSHIHGTLWIRVNGVDLPALGYFGVDDACMGTRAAELAAAVKELRRSDLSRYVFDEGEQGQPAFVFERDRKTVTIRLEPSAYGQGVAPPAWEPQTCGFDEFSQQIDAFLAALDATVSSATPEGPGWVSARIREAG